MTNSDERTGWVCCLFFCGSKPIGSAWPFKGMCYLVAIQLYHFATKKKKKGIETNKIINTQINQPLSVCYQVDLGVPLNCTLQIAYLQIY